MNLASLLEILEVLAATEPSHSASIRPALRRSTSTICGGLMSLSAARFICW